MGRPKVPTARVEDTPRADLTGVGRVAYQSRQGRVRALLSIGYGLRVQVRVNVRARRVQLQEPGGGWLHLDLAPGSKHWQIAVRCPECGGGCTILHWSIRGDGRGGECVRCLEAEYAARSVNGGRLGQELRRAVRAGQWGTLVAALRAGGRTALVARQSLEREGRAPVLYAVESGNARRWRRARQPVQRLRLVARERGVAPAPPPEPGEQGPGRARPVPEGARRRAERRAAEGRSVKPAHRGSRKRGKGKRRRRSVIPAEES